MTRIKLLAGAVVLALVFLAGRCSVPPPDDAGAKELARTKKAFDDATKARLELSDSLVTLAQERDSLADASQAEAARLRAVASRQRARADGMGVALARAQTAGDSIPILVNQVGALSIALDSTEAAADSFKAEVGRSREDVRNLILAVDVLRDQVRADSVRLQVQEGVIQSLRKAHSGCRVPLVKIKCPVVGPGYGLSFNGGQVRHGVTVSVTYPVIGGR